MDICLLAARKEINIKPISIHGILWLQTHFPTDEWDTILSGFASIALTEEEAFMDDVSKAGLSVNYLPILSNLKN